MIPEKIIGRMNNKVIRYLLVLSIFSFVSYLAVFPTNKIQATSDSDVIYDYVILIDTSGSMNDGTPPLFGQVQTVAKDFVNAIQVEANLAVYSFDTFPTLIGTWNNITSSDKSLIVNKIDQMTAPGAKTALWDAVCEGLSKMEEMGKKDGHHIQLLISYTDGEDNSSRNSSTTCLNKYEAMQKDGYTYWIYNAIGGVAVPDDVKSKEDIIGIVESTNPVPIRVVHIQPLELNLGNLFSSGHSNIETSCLVFWSSDPGIYGQVIEFNEPPIIDRALPGGTAPQICAEGTSCVRSFTITTSPSCLQFSLVNYLSENITSSDLGVYKVNLPVKVLYDSPENRIFIVPNKISIEFNLDYPPTATPTSTATTTPRPTKTPLPTSTITPQPRDTNVDCGDASGIDFGLIRLSNNNTDVSREITCNLEWQEYTLPQSVMISLNINEDEQDNGILFNYIGLSTTGELSNELVLNESDQLFKVVVKIPKDQVGSIESGKYSFVGEVKFIPLNTNIVGNMIDELTIPVQFRIKKPLSPFWFIGGAVAALLLLFVILLPRFISKRKPPVFAAVLSYTVGEKEERVILTNIVPSKVNSKQAELSVGTGSCDVKINHANASGTTWFLLIADKVGDKIDISILPKEPLRINDLPISAKKLLKSRDSIKVNDIEFKILIDKTS
jgi:hypothetical protein